MLITLCVQSANQKEQLNHPQILSKISIYLQSARSCYAEQ